MSSQLVLDAAVLRSITEIAGDQPQALLEELFTLLLESGETQLAVIRNAEPGDFDTIMRAAHTLKVGAGSVGAVEVAHISAQIETQARLRRLGPWQNMADDLHQALLRLRETAAGMGYSTAAEAA